MITAAGGMGRGRGVLVSRVGRVAARGLASSKIKHWTGHSLKPLRINKYGIEILHDPLTNNGMAFTYPDRDRLNIRGLVPPRYMTMETQVERALTNMRASGDDLHKSLYLTEMHDRNETTFFKLVVDNIEEVAPLIYTPTVGKVCQEFGQNYRRPRGMFFSLLDRGYMSSMIYNWPMPEVEVIVVTDGSRILGLGDLGCYGMGIPVGKLMLYCAAGGIFPHKVLPVMIDVGTNNKKLIDDPYYTGLKEPRVRGEVFFDVMDEFIDAVRSRFPNACIQFEDFATDVAQELLDRYRFEGLCFNDDIQGTGATTLGGIMSALKSQGKDIEDLQNERFLIAGAGSAGIGVATTLLQGMMQQGVSLEAARKQFCVVDKDGLLTSDRKHSLTPQQATFAREDTSKPLSILETAREFKPTVLLGLSAVGGLFTEELIREVAKHNKKPIIFPLSNPTSVAECTAEQCYRWTDGRAVFASGSPFGRVDMNGETYYPSQCNNLFIFPGVGLGSVACCARYVSDKMLYASSQALAGALTDAERAEGRVFPRIRRIREVSLDVAVAVAQTAIEEGVSRTMTKDDIPNLRDIIRERMYEPRYAPLVNAPHLK